MTSRKSLSKTIQAQVFMRDKWCCRYCGEEVYFSPALKALEEMSPNHDYYHRNGRKDKMSPHLLSRCAAVDHIIPVALGGQNDIENLVCACWQCNSAKSNEEPDNWRRKIIPIEKLVVADGWDGLKSILFKLDSDNEWKRYF